MAEADDRASDPLADLQRLEIGMAVADNGCKAEFGSVHDEVTREYQQRFVDQHRAELEEYRDAIAAIGG